MLQDINNLLETLNNAQKNRVQDCIQKGRYIVYALFASTWWVLNEIMEKPNDYAIYLIIAIILLIFYLALELLHYMLVAKQMRKYHKETVTYYKKRLEGQMTDKKDTEFILHINDKANNILDIAFSIFILQLFLLLVSVFLLGIYFCKNLNIL